jgi:hypothetical protein
MKFKLIFFAFTITLLTSCNSFDTVIEKQTSENIYPDSYGGCLETVFLQILLKVNF